MRDRIVPFGLMLSALLLATAVWFAVWQTWGPSFRQDECILREMRFQDAAMFPFVKEVCAGKFPR